MSVANVSNSMITSLVIAIVGVGLAVFLLSFKLLVGKAHEFPSSHIDDSVALQDKGIKCAKVQMKEEYGRENLQERLRK